VIYFCFFLLLLLLLSWNASSRRSRKMRLHHQNQSRSHQKQTSVFMYLNSCNWAHDHIQEGVEMWHGGVRIAQLSSKGTILSK
jgi:hypothetical protein